mgnify:CR=1 FL=1
MYLFVNCFLFLQIDTPKLDPSLIGLITMGNLIFLLLNFLFEFEAILILFGLVNLLFKMIYKVDLSFNKVGFK